MSRTYKGTIEQDFFEVEKLIKYQIINKELDYNFILENLKSFHSYFYKLRDVLEELQYKNNSSYEAIQDGIEGIFDFIWLLTYSRYKSSVSTFRSSMEILIKGLIREHCPEAEKNSFSNNIEKLIKELKSEVQRDFTSRKRKKLSEFLEENYTKEFIKLYKNFSNIVHGNYVNKKEYFSEYLKEIIDIKANYNSEQFIEIMDDATRLLRFVLELCIMMNFKHLNNHMNNFKFSLILDDLSDDFKEFKREYL